MLENKDHVDPLCRGWVDLGSEVPRMIFAKIEADGTAALASSHEHRRALWERWVEEGAWLAACGEAIRTDDRPLLESWLDSTNHTKQSILQFNGREPGRVLAAILSCARSVLRQQTGSSLDLLSFEDLVAEVPPAVGSSHRFPLSTAFCRDLAVIWGVCPPKRTIYESVALFPLVQTQQGEAPALLAQFRCEHLSEGQGEVFLAPPQALLSMDAAFRRIFLSAPRILDKLGLCKPEGDIRVHIEYYDRPSLLQRPLRGDSAGGALTLGLWSAWNGQPIDPGIVTSFALQDPDDGESDGECFPVGGDIWKAQAIADTKGGAGTFLIAADQPEDLDGRAEQMKLRIARAATLQDAVRVASGALQGFQDYLDQVIHDSYYLMPWSRKDGKVGIGNIAIPIQLIREELESTPAENDRELQGNSRFFSNPIDYKTSLLHEESALPNRKTVVSWSQERDRIDRAIIMGIPGSGKSFLIGQTATELAQAARDLCHRHGPPSSWPIPIPFRMSWLTLGGSSRNPVDYLVGGLRRDFSISPGFEAWLRDRLSQEQCWLLLDALDEAGEEERIRLGSLLNRMERDGWRCHILLTCRTANYDDSLLQLRGEFKKYELMPFNQPDVEQLVSNWFEGGTAGDTLLDTLRGNSSLAYACRSPLIATLACLGHEEGELTTMARRSDLYGHILHSLARRAWRGGSLSRNDPRTEDFLVFIQDMAWELFLRKPTANDFTHEEVAAALDRARDHARQSSDLAGAPAALETVRDRLLDCGILIGAVCDSSGTIRYSYCHHSFLEFMAACALNRRLKANASKPRSNRTSEIEPSFVDRCTYLPEWQEVIIFLAGCLDDPSWLVRRLIHEGVEPESPYRDDLFRHRLALAARCLLELPSVSITDNDALLDEISETLFPLCWDATLKSIDSTIPHLLRVLPIIVQLGGRILGSPLLEILTASLSDERPERRGTALRLLGAIGEAGATEGLLATLGDRVLSEDDADLRRLAARVLAGVGETAASRVLLPLTVAVLRDDQAMVRQRAAEGLEVMAGQEVAPKAIETLACCLREERNVGVLRSAVIALSRIGAASPDAAATLRECMSSQQNPQIRQLAVEALGNMTGVPSLDTIAAMKHCIVGDADAETRHAAVSTLGRWGGAGASPGVASLLVEAILQGDPTIGLSALEALAQAAHQARGQEGIGRQSVPVSVGDPGGWAVLAKGREGQSLRSPDMVATLTRCIQGGGNARVRQRAAEILGEMGGTPMPASTIAALVHCVRQEEDPRAQRAAVRALGKAGMETLSTVIPVLMECIETNGDAGVRQEAAALLRRVMNSGVRLFYIESKINGSSRINKGKQWKALESVWRQLLRRKTKVDKGANELAIKTITDLREGFETANGRT